MKEAKAKLLDQRASFKLKKMDNNAPEECKTAVEKIAWKASRIN
jgi:hypothetical protein